MGNGGNSKVVTWDGELHVVADIVREVSTKLHHIWTVRRLLTGSSLVAVLCIGALMCLMMWVATLEEDVEKGGIESKADAPYWLLIILMWAGMLVSSILLHFAFTFHTFRIAIRGSLEYTTLMIYELLDGQRFGYEEHIKPSAEETYEACLCREKHQLKVEAGLAGWTQEMIEEQIALLEEAYEAKERLQEAKKTSEKSQTATDPGSTSNPKFFSFGSFGGNFEQQREVVKKETFKLFSMVKNTIKANHCILGMVTCTFAIVTVGIGAMGAFLTIKIANMPDPDDNPLYIERCWQLINAIFSVIAVWKGPQRVLLLYYWFRKEWVQEVSDEDGVVVLRTLLSPGALLSHGQIGYIAGLRIVNVFCQYIVCFFMWAYLPRCLQEEKEQKIDCTSRPAWGVPVFLVMGMGTDITSNALLSGFIASCPYRKWPIEGHAGSVLEYKKTSVRSSRSDPTVAWTDDP